MNRTQLSLALDRLDRLYPNVLEPDYREDVRRLGASLPPLARLCRQLKEVLDAQRGTRFDALEAETMERVRDLHDRLRQEAQRLLADPHWPFD